MQYPAGSGLSLKHIEVMPAFHIVLNCIMYGPGKSNGARLPMNQGEPACPYFVTEGRTFPQELPSILYQQGTASRNVDAHVISIQACPKACPACCPCIGKSGMMRDITLLIDDNLVVQRIDDHAIRFVRRHIRIYYHETVTCRFLNGIIEMILCEILFSCARVEIDLHILCSY